MQVAYRTGPYRSASPRLRVKQSLSMLDVSLTDSTLGTVTFPRSTHTAIIGPAGSGKSTLLQIIAGDRKPQSGEVRIGSRDVTNLKRARRPLLYTTSAIDAPSRWSVRHLLVAAARQRTIDREDRQHEIEMASSKWNLFARPPSRYAVVDGENAREPGADRDSEAGDSRRGPHPRRRESFRESRRRVLPDAARDGRRRSSPRRRRSWSWARSIA